MPPPEDTPGLPVRVLYVDDYPDLADTAVLLLELVGFEAKAAYDGPTALRVAAWYLQDACVLDLNMPGMDGDEVAVRLRRQAADRPPLLVAVTARDDEESCKRVAAAGFDHLLVKPADPQRLMAVLAGECCQNNPKLPSGSLDRPDAGGQS
jgi:two-component system OmpR family response regulator